jgi:hypothetical protein
MALLCIHRSDLGVSSIRINSSDDARAAGYGLLGLEPPLFHLHEDHILVAQLQQHARKEILGVEVRLIEDPVL